MYRVVGSSKEIPAVLAHADALHVLPALAARALAPAFFQDHAFAALGAAGDVAVQALSAADTLAVDGVAANWALGALAAPANGPAHAGAHRLSLGDVVEPHCVRRAGRAAHCTAAAACGALVADPGQGVFVESDWVLGG